MTQPNKKQTNMLSVPLKRPAHPTQLPLQAQLLQAIPQLSPEDKTQKAIYILKLAILIFWRELNIYI